MKQLSDIANDLTGQPMFGLMAKAQEMERAGRKIIHFEIGDPDFNTPAHVIEAAKDALDANLTHYTNSMGLREFREAVVDYTETNWGFRPSIEQVLISPANAAIDFLARCVANPGDEIIYPDPGFPTYYSVVHYNGMVPVPVQLKEANEFRLDPRDVAEKITDKTRLIIMNSPSNPTGSVMTKEEVIGMAHLAKERDAYLLSDEIYFKVTYGKTHYSPSALDKCEERTIILGSLSKIYSMTGWRLGYAIGPEALIKKMGLLLETILSCLPAFTQLGGVAALTGDHRFLSRRMSILQERRDALVEGLNALPGVSCVVPDGAFYVLPNISKTGLTPEEYSEKLLEKAGVCVLPGSCFGTFGGEFVRLSYGSASVDVIQEALAKMKEFHDTL
ncbi:MAG: pyridoxal phosphate-dependent aminotransferase [Patescibacteria group bacterium]|nr:pyridoxal phosphate-dependent aminotransferase [Patescibacteria group bacterium]